jgi:hypothetical protein
MTYVASWMILVASTSVAGPPVGASAAATIGFPPVVGWLGQYHGFRQDGHFHVGDKVPHRFPVCVCAPTCEGFGPPTAFRDPEYFFNRQFAVPLSQSFLSSYWNPYITSGQRYIPYAGCGGCHPMSGLPPASATLPVTPYDDLTGKPPVTELPEYSGRREAEPVTPGSSGLIP